jgi:hypothetical protein
MRITICDVCDEKFDADAEMIAMLIPAEFLFTEGDPISVDICGWPCVNQLVDNALNNSIGDEMELPKPEEEEEEPPVKPFIMVPKTPTIDTNMDEKTLAQYTESVTGVKRRT